MGHTKTIGTEANLVDMTQIGQESVSPAVNALTVYPKEASTLLVIIAKKIIGSDRISVIAHLAVQMLLETRIKNSFRRLDTDYLTEILRTHLPTFTI